MSDWTPPGEPSGESSYPPYQSGPGQPSGPYQQGPYQQGPYQQGPYQQGPYQPGPAGPPYDGVSIASLVCSLTCCASIVGVVLGIVGLVRTKGGVRRGRWAAVTGLALGTVITVVTAGFVGVAIWFGVNSLDEGDVDAGQCVDVSSIFGENELREADCGDEHDAQVFATGSFTHDEVNDFEESRTRFCRDVMQRSESAWRAVVADGDYRVDGSTNGFADDDIDAGDDWVCFIERTDGAQFTGDLRETGGGDSTGA